ncbi:carbamate kinase [Fructilactobacillus vespulae]|uniref:carbamate kinase n=1 Tax=Fructilactobacillus vespulae TaxID=1249630 RepID=UPI0039B69AE7
MKKIVIALGGNAILTDDPSAKGQQAALDKTVRRLVAYLKQADEPVQMIINHGNGPQVGNLLLQEIAGGSEKNPAMPLDTLVAMTQGEIGFWLTNALTNHGIDSSTLVTRVLVDGKDAAFAAPSKPIGPFYSELAPIQKEHPDWQMVEDSGRGYRRVVPSPKPIDIVEVDQIKKLANSDQVVIVGGGGGVPVVKENGNLTGVEAVIDKDFTAAKLAERVDADELFILTAVKQAAINFGKPDQTDLGEVKVDELQKYLAEGQFGKGSMEPKIQAAIEFVEKTNQKAVITSLDNIADFEKNHEATVITK